MEENKSTELFDSYLYDIENILNAINEGEIEVAIAICDQRIKDLKQKSEILGKSQFIKIFKQIPELARSNIVWQSYSNNPMSFNVIYIEVMNNTKLGKDTLEEMGFD